MKRIISILLLITLALSLTACGGKQSLSKTLQNEEWVAVLDYRYNPGPNRIVSFEKDGKGSMDSSNNHHGDIEWSVSDNAVEVKYSFENVYGTPSRIDYNLVALDDNGYTMLRDDEHHFVLVPKANLEDAEKALKAEMKENAVDLDWSVAGKIASSNEAKFNSEYAGKIYRWTARPYNISGSNCTMSSKTANGNIIVYMDESDLAKLISGKEVTVIGILSGASFPTLTSAFIE